MVRIPGMFRNFEDLEDSLCLSELETLLEKAREVEHNRMKFQASLKGINLDAASEGATETPEEAFERVQRKAQALLAGKTEEELELAEIGIEFKVEE